MRQRKHVLRSGDDAGMTLVEVMMALSILAVGVVAVVGGMTMSTSASNISRQEAEASALTRSWAEAVASSTYTPCATTYAPAGFTLPTGWTSSVTVSYWDTTTSSFVATQSTCPASDSGLQRLRITVTSLDGRADDTLSVAKRSKPAGETP